MKLNQLFNYQKTTIMKSPLHSLLAISIAISPFTVHAEDKVVLEPAADEPAATADLGDELSEQPDGVLRVKNNDDGSFKSMVVKASVEIEDSLGAAKGKQIARKEAEIKCKQALVKWLAENCVFGETFKKTTSIITKGESSKDAAGNKVKLRNQQGAENKEFTEFTESAAQGILKGLIVLESIVTDAEEPEYVLIMGLSQENMDQAAKVAAALSAKGVPTKKVENREKSTRNDIPAAEKKTNPAIKDF